MFIEGVEFSAEVAPLVERLLEHARLQAERNDAVYRNKSTPKEIWGALIPPGVQGRKARGVFMRVRSRDGGALLLLKKAEEKMNGGPRPLTQETIEALLSDVEKWADAQKIAAR